MGWLILFLLYEIYAAKAAPKGDTLSENVWDWFGVKSYKPLSGFRRAILGAFMGVLGCHFVFGEPGGLGVILAGIPVGCVVVYSILFERKPVRYEVYYPEEGDDEH
jgi:hypothetical protein